MNWNHKISFNQTLEYYCQNVLHIVVIYQGDKHIMLQDRLGQDALHRGASASRAACAGLQAAHLLAGVAVQPAVASSREVARQ